MSQKSLSFWTIFYLLACLPLTTQKTNILKKWKKKKKKASVDVIILNLHYKKHDQMMYAYSDMECNSHFRPFFVLLPHYWLRKLKFGKNVISSWRYYPFKQCTINKDHMMYGSWDKKCKGQRFFSFMAIFCPLTLLTTQKFKILKK